VVVGGGDGWVAHPQRVDPRTGSEDLPKTWASAVGHRSVTTSHPSPTPAPVSDAPILLPTFPLFRISRLHPGSPMNRLSHLLGLVLLVLLPACGAPAPTGEPPAPAVAERTVSPAVEAAAAIRPEALRDHIHFLASDEMRGRDTPSPELEEAAVYIEEQLRSLGIQPAGDDGSFQQRWPFESLTLDQAQSRAGFEVDGSFQEWEYAYEYFAIPGIPRPVEGTPVYAPSPMAAIQGLPAEAAGAPLLVGLPEGLGPDFGLAIQAAMQAGAAGVVLLMDEEADASTIFQLAGALEGGAAGQMPIPIIGLRHDVGQELIARGGVEAGASGSRVLEGMTVSFRYAFDPETHDVPNVVGVLPGSDPALASEYVVILAHFDHVGVGPADETGDSIYSGADDNASGTAALMEVARAMTALPEAPARSILFLAVSGEEKGLLGANWFAQNPTVELDRVAAVINMDMVSRNAPDTVHAIGEEYSTLGSVIHEVARSHPELGLAVAPDPDPEEQAFLRSDHFPFVQEGIPALFITTWLHDDYHLPSDTPERTDEDKAARVTQLVFLTAHRVAEERERPQWTAAGQALLEQLAAAATPGP